MNTQNKLKISLLGTNQSFETPRTFLKIYMQNSFFDNIKVKHEGNISITKQIGNNDTNIKMCEIKNYLEEKNEIILTETDGIIIFFDLSKYDSLEVLDSQISHLKDKCNWSNLSTKKLYILGKYHIQSEKHPFLTEETMTRFMLDKCIPYDYIEMCTADSKDLVKILDFIICESYENKYRQEKSIVVMREDKSVSKRCIVY